MSTQPLRVLSLYEGFFHGGARILHTDLVAGLHGPHQDHSVLSLHSEVSREASRQPMTSDACYRRLVSAGVAVHAFDRTGDEPFREPTESEVAMAAGLVGGADVVLSLKEQPLRLLGYARIPRRPVVVCLHRTDPEHQGRSLAVLKAGIEAGYVTTAVCCAHTTSEAYARAGIPSEILKVIPNGVDTGRFRHDATARTDLRRALGIRRSAPVIVMAARYDRMKNVPLFLEAAQLYLEKEPDAHVLLCGAGMRSGNAELAGLLPDAGDRVHLLGVRNDMAKVYSAADVVALTSAYGEAAPLCLIEGMLCGAVPVTTDVGDSAAIVSGHGLVTPAEPYAIAAAWSDAVAQRAGGPIRPERARFDRNRMLDAYAETIHAAAEANRRPVAALDRHREAVLERRLDVTEVPLLNRVAAQTFAYTGSVDEEALARAFEVLCRRYPVLRGRVVEDRHGHLLTVPEESSPALVVEDGDETTLRAMARRDWDPASAVSELRLVRGPAAGFVVLCVDHAVADNAATEEMLTDLWTFYAELVGGRTPRITPKPLPRSPAALLAERAGFRPAPPIFAPLDHRAVQLTSQLDEQDTARLVRAARALGTSVHALVCGAVLTSLRRRSATPGPARMACLSRVNVRAQVTPPPASATDTTNLLGLHRAEVEVAPESDMVQVGATVKGQLTSAVAALRSGELFATDPTRPVDGPLEQHVAKVLITNIGARPAFPDLPGLSLPRRIIVFSDRTVGYPWHCVYTYAGRLSLASRYPETFFSKDDLRELVGDVLGNLRAISAAVRP
ncbi:MULTISPECIES: phthiocerol/phthiodiolone dimycocerosyl transferase family protein [Amycolatopsis]|uniref:Phthiocerol/phthiodiolone dimycocerosyl transferase n=2 Tax=Amycolatopsis TaxID=1813 RepID=A0A1I3WPK6_9PSEU|nr:glycosyltransferase [Amycolatopsis sacchari]SFK09604.1 Glycosyltransferase involved in cell wall bisynthesis [Amycolatopsis sacchari]